MNDLHDVDAAPRAAEVRTRSYVDENGDIWRVCELPFSEYDRRNGFSLIFSSDLAVRRVRDYPADWFDLDERALAKLSWRV